MLKSNFKVSRGFFEDPSLSNTRFNSVLALQKNKREYDASQGQDAQLVAIDSRYFKSTTGKGYSKSSSRVGIYSVYKG